MADTPAGVMDPTSVSFMAGAGAVLSFTDLDEDERLIFDRDLKRLAQSFTARDRELGSLFMDDRDTYLWAASIAKKQLSVPFKGLLALGSGTFGMQPIRSVYIMSGNPQGWLQSFTSTGWTSKTFNVNLATSTGSATNTQNRVVLVAPRVINYAISPKVNQLRWVVGPTTYPVQVLDWFKLTNLWIAQNPGAIFVSKNGTFTTDLQVESTGTDGTALFGLAFGTGDWLAFET